MLIRRAAADESDALSDLAHRAKAHWGYPAHWMRRWDAQLTILPGYLEMHDVWVVEEDGAIVGMCALEDLHTRWHLEHVWVEPARHGHGIGRALVMHVVDEARRRHAGVIELLSDPFACGFYEKLGARKAGEVPAPMPGARERTLPKYEFASRSARACP